VVSILASHRCGQNRSDDPPSLATHYTCAGYSAG
jgi:hypothetical protein